MEQITISGLVATTPRHIKTQDGLDIMSFRLASSVLDKKAGQTNWYTITLFKRTAVNAYASIHKGDRVLLTGALKVRDWDNGERAGTSVEVEATAIGHDLAWGESTFNRTVLVMEEDDKQDELEAVKQELADLRQKLSELAEEN